MRSSASVRSFDTRSRAATAASGRKAAFFPNHNININSCRPLTAAAGIARDSSRSSSKPTSTRTVHDGSYYHSLLTRKVEEVENEVQRLTEKIEEIKVNCSKQASRKEVYDSLLGQVNQLEESIVDYNFAVDKDRSGSDPEEIEALAFGLSEENEQQANEVDQLFMKNQYHQHEIKNIENEITKLRASFKSLLDNSDKQTIHEYERLTAQLKDLKYERIEVEGEIGVLQAHVDRVQAIANRRNDKDICERLDGELDLVNCHKIDLDALEETVYIAQMDVDDARLYFLDKVKGNKAIMINMSKEDDELQKKIRELKSKERQIVALLQDDDSTNATKNDMEMKMYWKVKEAQEYISSAEGTIDSIRAECDTKKSTINSLTETLSKRLQSSKVEMPTQEHFRNLNDTVSFKSKHLANSQITMKRLLDQRDKRRLEVEKVRHLETRIRDEEEELMISIDNMKKELNIFDDIGNLEDEAEAKKENLQKMKERYITRGGFVKCEAKKLSEKFEKAKSLLEHNTVWKSLEMCESKIARQSQVVHKLQLFVSAHGKETEYESIKKTCLDIVENLNRESSFAAQ